MKLGYICKWKNRRDIIISAFRSEYPGPYVCHPTNIVIVPVVKNKKIMAGGLYNLGDSIVNGRIDFIIWDTELTWREFHEIENYFADFDVDVNENYVAMFYPKNVITKSDQ